ncbi:MAG: DUF5071 domain-containing protein [Propionibacteriaceae bacterium]|jgi:hypothetical protein|nr:DUF5071 domain-containing protein [Propionibacteriaceae bacterium]
MFECSPLVPKDKFDTSSIAALQAVEILEVQPILGDLLAWIRDINWPVAQPLMEVLPRFHRELVPHIKAVFESDDDVWKCWTLSLLESFPRDTVELLASAIRRMAEFPTPGEVEEEACVYAQRIVDVFKL